MKYGTVKDYLCAARYCGQAYERKLVTFLKDQGQQRLAAELEAAFGRDRERNTRTAKDDNKAIELSGAEGGGNESW